VAHLVAAIDPLRIIDASAYETRLTRLLDTLGSGRLMKGVERILLPGDREYATEAVRLRQGIPLERPVAEELFTAGDGVGVPRPPLLS
jgi:LDH2 family malate/lactate/ureidoglycolate dehydrogenase